MRVEIEYNGYHGTVDCGTYNLKGKPGDSIYFSQSQIRRINAEVCGMPDCRCGEGVSEYMVEDIRLPAEGEVLEIVGNYPQI
mgnify:CR=1 FL=1